jgi:hypothetical protein
MNAAFRSRPYTLRIAVKPAIASGKGLFIEPHTEI